MYGGFGKGQLDGTPAGTPGMAGDLWQYYIIKSGNTDFSNSRVRLMPSSVIQSSGTDFRLTYPTFQSFAGVTAPFRAGGAMHYVTYNGTAHLFLHGGHTVSSTSQFDSMYADTWLYRLSDNRWAWVAGLSTNAGVKCPTSPLPSPMASGSPYPRAYFASCMSADSSSIYMFGGITRVCTGASVSRKISSIKQNN
jgi:hypothetical protein